MSSSAAHKLGDAVDLSVYGINGAVDIVHNPSFETLFTEETRDDFRALNGPLLLNSELSLSTPASSPVVPRKINTSLKTM